MTFNGSSDTAAARPGIPVQQTRLDVGRCFAAAWEVYRKNFWTLVAAAIVFDLLSLVTILVLAGPLCGGWCVLTLNALSRPDRKVEFGLLFNAAHQFGTLLALFFVTLVAELVGLTLLVIPGLLLMTVWLFPFHLVVDRNLGMRDALRTSALIVARRGIGPNFILAALALLMTLLPMFIPYVGWVASWFMLPLGWLLVSAAYIQQVREHPEELSDLLPQGFPVTMAPPPAPAPPSAADAAA